MKKLFSILLIIIGSGLEIYYYAQRFVNDGITVWLSIIIGISLTLFLSLLMLKRDNKIIWLLIVPLAVYSILCTSAGQSFSLSEMHNSQVAAAVQEDNRSEQIKEYKHEIELLDKELEKLSDQITVNTTWARSRYGDAVEAVQKRQDEIKSEKKVYQDQINALRAQQTVSATREKETTSIYQFYYKLFGFNAGILQFILQTILSFFIASMAPFAIILMTSEKPEPVKKRKYTKKQGTDYSEYIEKFVNVCWIPFRKNRSDKIVDKRQFVDWMRQRKKSGKESILFTDKIFDIIKNHAIKQNIIDENGIIKYTGTEQEIISLIKESMNGRNEKRTDKG